MHFYHTNDPGWHLDKVLAFWSGVLHPVQSYKGCPGGDSFLLVIHHCNHRHWSSQVHCYSKQKTGKTYFNVNQCCVFWPDFGCLCTQKLVGIIFLLFSDIFLLFHFFLLFGQKRRKTIDKSEFLVIWSRLPKAGWHLKQLDSLRSKKIVCFLPCSFLVSRTPF